MHREVKDSGHQYSLPSFRLRSESGNVQDSASNRAKEPPSTRVSQLPQTEGALYDKGLLHAVRLHAADEVGLCGRQSMKGGKSRE